MKEKIKIYIEQIKNNRILKKYKKIIIGSISVALILGVFVGASVNPKSEKLETSKIVSKKTNDSKTNKKETKKEEQKKDSDKKESNEKTKEEEQETKTTNAQATQTQQTSSSSSGVISSGGVVYPRYLATEPQPLNWTTVNSPGCEESSVYYPVALNIYQNFVNGRIGPTNEVSLPLDANVSTIELSSYVDSLSSSLYAPAGYVVSINYTRDEGDQRVWGYMIKETYDHKTSTAKYATDLANYQKAKQLESLIVSIIGSGVTEQQAVNRMMNWLEYNVSYDNSHAADSYTEFGVLNGRAVCAGYTKFVQYCMNMYGIPCEYISGIGGGISHAWNRVQIGGVWYYLDATWGYGLSQGLWGDHQMR